MGVICTFLLSRFSFNFTPYKIVTIIISTLLYIVVPLGLEPRTP